MSTATPFAFAGQQVEPGTRVHLELPAGKLPSGTSLSLPVEVIHGRQRGPTVWLSGAIHGDEIVGVEIIRQVTEELDLAELAGTVVAVPVVNVFGVVAESRYLPDRRDLNRSFPGSKRGSLATQLSPVGGSARPRSRKGGRVSLRETRPEPLGRADGVAGASRNRAHPTIARNLRAPPAFGQREAHRAGDHTAALCDAAIKNLANGSIFMSTISPGDWSCRTP